MLSFGLICIAVIVSRHSLYSPKGLKILPTVKSNKKKGVCLLYIKRVYTSEAFEQHRFGGTILLRIVNSMQFIDFPCFPIEPSKQL